MKVSKRFKLSIFFYFFLICFFVFRKIYEIQNEGTLIYDVAFWVQLLSFVFIVLLQLYDIHMFNKRSESIKLFLKLLLFIIMITFIYISLETYFNFTLH